MLTTIEFDSKPGFLAIEIEDEAPNGMLPTKLEPSDVTISEQQPEQILCIGLMYPE